MLAAMPREVVEKNGIGDSADAIWKNLHQDHEKLFDGGIPRPSESESLDRWYWLAMARPSPGDSSS
jgi:hypothetical protein